MNSSASGIKTPEVVGNQNLSNQEIRIFPLSLSYIVAQHII